MGAAIGPVRIVAGGETSPAELSPSKGKGLKSIPIGNPGDATKELVTPVSEHTYLYVGSPGTDEGTPENRNAYTYAFEGVTLKDGLSVGTMTAILPALVPM